MTISKILRRKMFASSLCLGGGICVLALYVLIAGKKHDEAEPGGFFAIGGMSGLIAFAAFYLVGRIKMKAPTVKEVSQTCKKTFLTSMVYGALGGSGIMAIILVGFFIAGVFLNMWINISEFHLGYSNDQLFRGLLFASILGVRLGALSGAILAWATFTCES